MLRTKLVKVTDIPKNELEEISKEYDGWKNSGFKDAVRTAASIHKSIAKVVTFIPKPQSKVLRES